MLFIRSSSIKMNSALPNSILCTLILSTFALANILSPKKYEAKTILENRVARSKKNKKAKFCHKLFQKRPNPEK